ncbi:DUF6270 domain-containing protein [Arthrobacter sp. AQ5-05]|uniref:DUF6270 domain-containing protein n=1 Tax=Arthrobacter sp. AQ5-05 TaxID=2184581 RepID=UPI0011BFE6EA|nr:DUF6270 domain-containing protein [Arthrobacter sp. AQ5-05]
MPNIFLYGGCVIRDSYKTVQEHVGLSGYVARQSLISAINPPAKLREVTLESPFQSRMLNGDISSTLLHTLRRAASITDLFVMDCHVERGGVYRLRDGAFLTPSAELKMSGLLREISGHVHVPLGTERHTRFWENAAKRFVKRLEEYGLKDKALVIDAPWAEEDEGGVPFGERHGMPIREVSASISHLTGILSGLGVRVERMPKKVATAPVEHEWGSGPYHFGPAAMGWASDVILDALESQN